MSNYSGLETVCSYLNSNIPATLDLAQSLQTFEETVASAIALGDVSTWDGRTLKQREQKIRYAALILAGQCIALLLHTLAQSSTAHITAATQTSGMATPHQHRTWKASGSSSHPRQCGGIPVAALCCGTSPESKSTTVQ